MFQQFSQEDEKKIKDCLSYCPSTGCITWVKHNYKKSPLTRAGSVDKSGYLRVHICGKKIAGHRLAWFLYYGEWPKGNLDHIDRDRLNNRIENLRLATKSQNSMNRQYKDKGVGYYPKYKKWRARICVGSKSHLLGYFHTKREALNAYKIAAEKLHGDFACLD